MDKMLSREKTFPKKLLMQALAGQVTPQVPFWLMRQAGRYLPEYRVLRAKAGLFLNLCFNPELAAEVTLQPIRWFDMDAAILFSDILVVPYAMGQQLEFAEGDGPRLSPLRRINEIDFSAFDKKLQPVYETIHRIKKDLSAEKTLLGFAGAPWTLACYMVQGHGSGEFSETKKFAFGNPQEFDKYISILATATSHHLINQIRAGADAVQIFDSWAGLLPEPYFERWVVQPTKKIVEVVNKSCPGVPVIGFPRNAGKLYRSYAEKSGVNCVGIDQYFPLSRAVQEFGDLVSLQGNLDPEVLLQGGKVLEKETFRILQEAGNSAFIFNLGHGVIKETPPEHVAQLAQILRDYRR